jgi:hypothetical protein
VNGRAAKSDDERGIQWSIAHQSTLAAIQSDERAREAEVGTCVCVSYHVFVVILMTTINIQKGERAQGRGPAEEGTE